MHVESPTSRAVADLPGASETLVTGLALRAAGLPRGAPALISWMPGKPVSEQVLAELLVNCRKAYWCPAAPEARSAATPSVALGQPVGPAVGTRDGLLGARVTEEGAAVGRAGLATAVALQVGELAGAELAGAELAGAELAGAADAEVLVDGAVEAAGCSVAG